MVETRSDFEAWCDEFIGSIAAELGLPVELLAIEVPRMHVMPDKESCEAFIRDRVLPNGR